MKTKLSLRDKYPYFEFFWSIFSRIWTEYKEMLRISPYSVQVQENWNKQSSEYGYFSRGVC